MQATIRQIRNTASGLGRLLPPLTGREYERYQEILQESPALLMHHPRSTLTFAMVAISLRTTATTLRRYFADIDDLIGNILLRELQRITEAFAKVPRGPGRAAECRKLYFDLTRTGSWDHNPVHRLMIRDRHDLPCDLRDPIDAIRHALGVTMAGDFAEGLLGMFEQAYLSLEEVDAAADAIIRIRAASHPCADAPDQAPPPAMPPLLAAPEQAAQPEQAPDLPREPAPQTRPASPAQPHPAVALLSDAELVLEPEKGQTPAPHPFGPASLQPEPQAPRENRDLEEKPLSANDSFFLSLGISPRGRPPPK